MQKGDWLLVQNETNGIEHAVKSARQHGLKVALAAAPFSAEALVPILPHVDLLALNHIEFKQLTKAAGPDAVRQVAAMLITHGADGAEYREGAVIEQVPSYKVVAVDTTGAGDTFLGYFLGAIDQRSSVKQAVAEAAAAAALMVTRHGASRAIPSAQEVETFRMQYGRVT
jgi:ribokinase